MAQNPTITKCLVGEARMNFAHVFTPDSFDDKSEPKYSVILAFPKSDKALYNKVQKAIDECVEKAKAKYGGALPKKFNVIEIVDGDDWDEKFDLSEYYTLKASSSYKPEVVKKSKVMGKVQLVPIENEEEFYSGCYGFASVTFYAYDTGVSKGVTCGLNSLLKSRDGEKLGSSGSAAADFADVLDDIVDLDDISDEDL